MTADTLSLNISVAPKEDVKLINKVSHKRKLNDDEFFNGADEVSEQKRERKKNKTSGLFRQDSDVPLPQIDKDFEPVSETLFSNRDFKDISSIHPYIVSNLEQNFGITKMTTVQQLTIPILLTGKDALVRSQTGSGKTIAYAVPILHTLQNMKPKISRQDGVRAIVILPTRELALQTYECFLKLVRAFARIVPGILVGAKHSLGLCLLLAIHFVSLSVGEKIKDCPDSLPLHDVVEHGTPDQIDELVQQGVDLYAVDCKGLSAMHLAIKVEKIDMIYQLASNDFDVNYHFAKGETILFYAIDFPSTEVVQTLIDLGSQVNTISDQGITPLLKAMLDKSAHVQLLKDHGAIYDVTLPGGDTPLHKAAESGNIRVIRQLFNVIKYETVDVKNNNQETPLFKAVTHNHPAAINVLIASGANKDLKIMDDKSYVYFAVKSNSPNSLRALLEYGASPEECNRPFDLFPLNKAVENNNQLAAALLLQFGVNKECAWKVGHYKGQLNVLQLAAYKGYADGIVLLHDLGFDIDYKNEEKNTALHIAAEQNQLKSAEALLKLGACRTCMNDKGLTPVDLVHTDEMKNLFTSYL